MSDFEPRAHCANTLHMSDPPERTEWTTAQLREDFTVEGFSMGFVVVRRKSDGALGSLNFKRVNDANGEAQRVYFGWVAD